MSKTKSEPSTETEISSEELDSARGGLSIIFPGDPRLGEPTPRWPRPPSPRPPFVPRDPKPGPRFPWIDILPLIK